MTTPANFNSAYRIICEAMWNAGKLATGVEPNSEDLARYMNRLNDLINLWQTQGLKLWLQLDQSVTLVSGQASYTIKSGGDVNLTKPTRIIDSGYYLDSNSVKRPLTIISRDEYARLSTVTQTGPITQYWVDKQVSQLVVYFWLVPDATAATGTAHLCVQQQITNLVSLTDSMNFPQEWFMALHWGLADEICTGQPQTIVDRCAQRASMYRTMLEDWDVEDASTKLQPDLSQTSYGARGFS